MRLNYQIKSDRQQELQTRQMHGFTIPKKTPRPAEAPPNFEDYKKDKQANTPLNNGVQKHLDRLKSDPDFLNPITPGRIPLQEKPKTLGPGIAATEPMAVATASPSASEQKPVTTGPAQETAVPEWLIERGGSGRPARMKIYA